MCGSIDVRHRCLYAELRQSGSHGSHRRSLYTELRQSGSRGSHRRSSGERSTALLLLLLLLWLLGRFKTRTLRRGAWSSDSWCRSAHDWSRSGRRRPSGLCGRGCCEGSLGRTSRSARGGQLQLRDAGSCGTRRGRRCEHRSRRSCLRLGLRSTARRFLACAHGRSARRQRRVERLLLLWLRLHMRLRRLLRRALFLWRRLLHLSSLLRLRRLLLRLIVLLLLLLRLLSLHMHSLHQCRLRDLGRVDSLHATVILANSERERNKRQPHEPAARDTTQKRRRANVVSDLIIIPSVVGGMKMYCKNRRCNQQAKVRDEWMTSQAALQCGADLFRD